MNAEKLKTMPLDSIAKACATHERERDRYVHERNSPMSLRHHDLLIQCALVFVSKKRRL